MLSRTTGLRGGPRTPDPCVVRPLGEHRGNRRVILTAAAVCCARSVSGSRRLGAAKSFLGVLDAAIPSDT
jgi:hypothetical protein